MTIQPYKIEFIEFMVRSGALTFGDFVTKSGRKTPYFINTGKYHTGAQAAALGGYYAGALRARQASGELSDKINCLFGPAYKGIPLAVGTAIALQNRYQTSLHYCFDRKEEKDHGEGGSLVGYKPGPDDEVVIIEDVITAGTAIRQVMPIFKKGAPGLGRRTAPSSRSVFPCASRPRRARRSGANSVRRRTPKISWQALRRPPASGLPPRMPP